ncbi:MAG: PAS domain S-box protein [Nitrospirae bacterium]|nr:PAS domain S-box protein [Nitrospirota bacterium]
MIRKTATIRQLAKDLSISNDSLLAEIDERKRVEEVLKLNELRLEAMVQLSHLPDTPLSKIMDFVLEKGIVLTGSKIGFIAFGNEDESLYTIQALSATVMKECAVTKEGAVMEEGAVMKKGLHLRTETAGLWAEAVRLRKPVIVNNYENCATGPFSKKGYPVGHVPLTSIMAIPTFADNRIVAVSVIGNKEKDYNQTDVYQLTLLMDAMWYRVERRDVSEKLRLTNIYNRSLIEASPDPFVTITPDGRIGDVNSATEAVTGYSRAELIGTCFSDYFTEPEKAVAGYRKALYNGKLRDYELFFRHRDGYTTPVVYNASVYKDGTGNVLGLVATARDITEQKSMQSKLNDTLDNLRQSQELLIRSEKMSSFGLLAAKMAHEINNPLTSVSIKLQTLKSRIIQRGLGGDILNKVNMIEGRIDKISSIIKELLLVSRSGDNEFIPVSINDVITGSITLLEHKLYGITVHRDLSNIPGIDGDPLKMEMVFINLLDNAISAMSGKGDIFIKTYYEEKMVISEITDTGEGIKEEYMKNIFDPFFTTKEVGTGIGLGLSTCYGIISRHNGTIDIKSSSGKGTTVTIKLPEGGKQ